MASDSAFTAEKEAADGQAGAYAGSSVPESEVGPRLAVVASSGALLRTLLGPSVVLACGLGLAALGAYYAAVTGQVFRVGSFGLSWITVPCVLFSGISFLMRLVRYLRLAR